MSEEMDEQGYYPTQITEPIKKGKKQLEQELEIATKMIGQLRAEMVSMRLQVSNYKKYISELKNKDDVQEQQD
jgi:hypothetical protein